MDDFSVGFVCDILEEFFCGSVFLSNLGNLGLRLPVTPPVLVELGSRPKNRFVFWIEFFVPVESFSCFLFVLFFVAFRVVLFFCRFDLMF